MATGSQGDYLVFPVYLVQALATVQVYVGDLESDGTRFELEDAFAAFGAVKNIWIAKKPPGKSL